MSHSVVIFDTEFTAWPGSAERGWSLPQEHREIIQIAAVRVSLEQSFVRIEETFNELVVPCINDQLSDYIIALTGISQEMLQEMGIDFPSCFKQFSSFVGQENIACLSWGNDESVLLENCQINHCQTLWPDHHFINLKQIALNKSLPGANSVSGEIAKALGFDIPGRVHNALHDVRSITLALEHWLKSGELLMADIFTNTQQ